jgi:hypothetical protein
MAKRSLLSIVAVGVCALSVALWAHPVAAPIPSGSTSPTQPPISWDSSGVSVILAPGGSTSVEVSFTSGTSLQGVTVEPVPEIAGFLSLSPASIPLVLANSSQKVTILFSIPQDATLGVYSGTIHIRVRNQTFPQTLKVTVKLWQRYQNPDLGVQFLLPPTMVAQPITDTLGSAVYVGPSGEEFPNGLTVTRYDKSLADVLAGFTSSLQVVSQKSQSINGHSWVIYDFIDATGGPGGPEFLDAFTSVNGVIYQVGGKALAVRNVLGEFLSTFQFQ